MPTTSALGVNPKDDLWPKYAFKMATGSGKTKVMSLAIVWSYFHSLFEEGSTLASDFLIIAPNITVFERLKEDFGDGKIFETDPLIPQAWRGDWNMSVSLQDEAGGAATGGKIYLTNIHRLYDLSKRKGTREVETPRLAGPGRLPCQGSGYGRGPAGEGHLSPENHGSQRRGPPPLGQRQRLERGPGLCPRNG